MTNCLSTISSWIFLQRLHSASTLCRFVLSVISKIWTTLFFRNPITSSNPYEPLPVFVLISLNRSSTNFFSSTNLKLPSMSPDLANASLIPSAPE